MANFVAYTKRLSDRRFPTIHVVDAYAGGGGDFINVGLDGADQRFYGDDATIDGMCGSSGPDNISYHEGVVGTTEPNFATRQVVGVQVTRIESYSSTGTKISAVKGAALCQYVEKTEHQYLANGHLQIMVYFLEDSMNGISSTNGGLVLQFNVLLQGSNSLIAGVTEMRGSKEHVKVTLNVPFDDGATASHNPSIDLDAWLYGGGGTDFGQHVRVQDIGLTQTKQIWNTVRTQVVGHNTFGADTLPEPSTSGNYSYPAGSRIYPLHGVIPRKKTAEPAGYNFRHIDNCRELSSRSTYQSLITNFGGAQVFGSDSYARILMYDKFTASGDLLHLGELFGHAQQDTLNSDGFSTKEQWGKYTGVLCTSFSRQDPNYGPESLTDYPGGWPTTGTGNALSSNALATNTPLGLFTAFGGQSRVFLDGSSRNPYDGVIPITSTTQGNVSGRLLNKQYSNYVTFYCIDGTSWGDNNNIPSNINNTPADQGQITWGGHVGDIIRQSVSDILGTTATSLVDDNCTRYTESGPFEYGSLTSYHEYVGQGFGNWQNYVGFLFNGTSVPNVVSAKEDEFTSLTGGTNHNDALPDIFDVKFSAAISPVALMTGVKMLAMNKGIDLLTNPVETDQFYGMSGALGGNADPTIDVRGKKLFTYTVFVYTDSSQSKVPVGDQVHPFGSVSGEPAEISALYLNEAYSGNGNIVSTQASISDIPHIQDLTFDVFINSSFSLTVGLPHFDWGAANLVDNKCVDRNSVEFSSIFEINSNSSDFIYINANECSVDYKRCGCREDRQDYITDELGYLNAFNYFESFRNQYEAVITYPRPVTTHQSSILAPSATYTSILYVNSYFSVKSTAASPLANNSYAAVFLNISNEDPSQVTYRTSDDTPHTHLLEDGDFSTLSVYPQTIWFDELDGKSIADNTFTFFYLPGRDHYESVDGSSFFAHDESTEAKAYLTVGSHLNQYQSTPFGAGIGELIPNRQYLLFEAETSATKELSSQRAHSDLEFGESWTQSDTEASYISLGATADCITAEQDKPKRKVNWFVNVGRKVSQGIDDGGGDDGGGGDDDKPGCTDPNALNYDATATLDDGTCVFCDDTFTENAAATFTNLDPIFLLPHAYGGRDNTNYITGSTAKTQGAQTVNDGGCDGDLHNCNPEVLFGQGFAGNEVFEWWDGNYFNAFNTRGPNTDFTVGALNGANPSSPFAGSPWNNEADSAQTFFQAKAGNSGAFNGATEAIFDQFGVEDAALKQQLLEVWESLAAEQASNLSMHIFRYEDWNKPEPLAVRRNVNQGNNGWALDSYTGTLGPGKYKANVYADTQGDFSGIGFHNMNELATLPNQESASFELAYKFGNIGALNNPTVNTDIGLEAGHHYVAILKFRPKRTCPVINNETLFYYWAYNFFVEYCACTNDASENGGYGNPDQAALSATEAPYWVDAPWGGSSYFPATNAPYSGIMTGTFGSTGVFPTTFCGAGAASRLIGGGRDRVDDSALGNTALCAVRDPDSIRPCEDFYSWCLSDISVTCNFDGDGNPFLSLDFAVLIDGFFTQSETDPYNLQPIYETGQVPPNEYYYWRINVLQNGEETYSIDNYIPASDSTYELNPAIDITNSQAEGATDYIGNLASLNFTGIEWSDDVDGVAGVDDLQLDVQLVYLGTINIVTGAINNSYPDFIVDAEDNPVDTCPVSELSYTASLGGCEAAVTGCTDPLATNFDPNATEDDGSCRYTDCEELFDSFKSSIFITDVTTTNDTLQCTEFLDIDVDIDYYIPQYSATMVITIEDYAAGVLGVSNLGLTEGQFTICVLRMQEGAATLLPSALQYFNDNAEAIQALNPGVAFNIGAEGNGLNGCFLAPEVAPSPNVTSTASQTDPAGLPGTKYITDLPADTIFSDGEQLLTAGQYLIFVIPFVDLSGIQDAEGNGLGQCDDIFINYIDEVTISTIGATVDPSATCPEPCNQFTNPEDCPDAKPGCTNPDADNYNPEATFDDGSCEFCTDCDPCVLYPLAAGCGDCEKGEGAQSGNRVAGFGARIRECDGETEECCTDPTACNYREECQVGKNELCEYNCNDGGDDCEGVADEDCDDEEPTCPDPSNPECEGDPIGNCLEDGDCPCVGTQCNEDCIFEDENCNPPVVDPEGDDPITDVFTTTTAICIPTAGPGADMSVYFADGSQATDLGEAGAVCSAHNGDKMLMKMRTGVTYETTDLLKLSLINYLLTKAATTQLDCILDCNNYDSGAKSGGKILAHTSRFRGEINCQERWKAGRRQYFAGSSSFKRGDIVRYLRVMNGVMTGSYFIAKNDWIPGMDIPGSVRDITVSSWTPCINVKYQENTNPENYYQTFYEFINRYCQSCRVVLSPEENRSNYMNSQNSKSTYVPNRSFGAGFADEDGNEIIF